MRQVIQSRASEQDNAGAQTREKMKIKQNKPKVIQKKDKAFTGNRDWCW